jgi:hypothetical protein
MRRALSLAKTIGSLLVIEMCVPGGTLIVLTLLLTGRSDSPLLGFLSRRVPALSRVFAR